MYIIPKIILMEKVKKANVISDSEVSLDGRCGSATIEYDILFADVAREAVTSGQISISKIQHDFGVGFNRAGRIMSQLECAGIVGQQVGTKPRTINFHDILSLEVKLQDLGLS